MQRKTTHTIRAAGLSLAAAVALSAAAGARAQQCGVTKLTAGDAATADFFGSAVALYSNESGLRLMVGARFDDTAAGANAGSVYTFGRFANGQWGFLAPIQPTDGQLGDYFGFALDVQDPHAVIGAPGAGGGGAAYFFERVGTPWAQRSKLTLTSPVVGDDFGASAAISGAWAIVGAPGRDFASNHDGGAAYICRRNSNGAWTIHTSLRGDNMHGLDAGSRLGSAVDMYSTVAVVGAPFYSSPNWPDHHGAVRVYRRDAQEVWQWEDVLTSNNPGENDYFGAAVSVHGLTIAVGAPGDDRTEAQGGALTDSGCVYLYRFIGLQWTFDGQLFAPDAASFARFGSCLKLDGDRLLVGAGGAGRAYTFQRVAGEWVCVEALTDPDGPDGFAASVDLLGDTVAVGDDRDDHSGITNAGAAYVRRQTAASSDSCAGAHTITSSVYTGCTEFATRDGTATCGNPAVQGPDVWYAWNADCSGTVVIDTLGSEFDTVLSVHSGCPDDATSVVVACSDDGGPGYGVASLVAFEAEAGARYLIRVSGYNGARGEFTLNVHPFAAPANDTCAAAQDVTVGQHAFVTCGAQTDGPAVTSCFSGVNFAMSNDVWFRYTAQCSGAVTVSACGSTFDTVLAVYSGGSCPTQTGPAMACNDDIPSGACPTPLASQVTFPALQGEVYLIRLGSFTADRTGDGLLSITCQSPCRVDWNGDGRINSADISAFLSSWIASVQAGDVTADFDASGTTNSADISAFLAAWLAALTGGC